MLFDALVKCSPDGNECYLHEITGVRQVWLVLETACFYAYMFATVVYIAGMGISSACRRAPIRSDFKKAIKDFIGYAAINLTWFALNFVLCTMPAFCIFVFPNDGLEIEGNTGSYLSNMYLLWGIHVITFLPKLRIYKINEPKT